MLTTTHIGRDTTGGVKFPSTILNEVALPFSSLSDQTRVSLMDENLVEEADKKSIKDEPLSSDEEDEYAIQVDEADGEEDLEKTELLPYENNLMVDTMDDDVLFIAARGLGLERLFQLHLQLYSSQKLLVLVLNTNQNDEYFFLKKLKECGVDSPPKVLNSELSVQLRESLYHAGGVQFVTSRILMTDLLTGRIPVENVSGVVVYRAHTVMTSFQESFIIRLLREKKPNIFVKAFTDSASAIAARGIGQLQRLVDKLYVRRVRLLPRFDVEVKSCFEKDAPRLIEIMVDVPMSYRKAITPLVDIIRTCVKELKQCSPRIAASVAEESASPWSGITPSALEIELKKNTITLTEKQQRLLKELDELRAILGQIQDLDPITAYRSFKSIRSGKDVINANSGWVFTRTAGKIYAALEDIVKARDSKGEPAILHPAKWAALRSSLEEIRETAVRRFTEGNTTPINILILASSNTVCSQMAELLRFGIPSLVSNLHKELANEEGKDCEVLDASPIWEPHRIALFGMDTKQYKKDREGMMTELIQEQKKVARDGRKRRAKAQGVKGKSGGAQTLISEFGIVHYKKMRGWNTTEERVAGSKDGEVTEVEANTEAGGSSQPCDEPPFEDPQIVILPHGERYKLINHLESLKPEFVVFYNTDLVSLRIVEMFKAVEQCPMNVYSLMYRESTEEDRYLCAIQREQLAFEQLLREQMVLLIPREYNVEREQPPVIQKSTRDGRATQPAETPKIIVDMREFNSELPTVLYQKGIDVVPSTIEVGDYILSDEIAVERKALDDLTQSLHSGRIFKQIQEMTLHYKHTVLLIESREKFRMKMVNGGPFQGELSRRCRDTRSLFCILLRSTPSIQCVWSLDPQNTAELFEELKMNQANPSVEKALAIKCNDGANEQGSSASTDKSSKASENKQKTGKPKNINKVLQRQLTNIPGLAAGDVERIMKSETIGNLYELANASESTLMEANGQNAVQAQKLVNFFSVDFRNM
ncbi:hypothetical protein QR680_016013 [Steinernema hermaphroditum]|uniref:DNA repair endonuclease XPF n=1 Tax=Steinernema hermaphroditum TaxID=289476 RepID=A0AA39H9R3_9BILA|nr:hypothetical protein QR680_016013 [Steinernema hermaphroditum]